MRPENRLAIILLGSLALWVPTLRASALGEIDLDVALLWYVAGLAFVAMAVVGIDWLVTSYARSNAAVPGGRDTRPGGAGTDEPHPELAPAESAQSAQAEPVQAEPVRPEPADGAAAQPPLDRARDTESVTTT